MLILLSLASCPFLPGGVQEQKGETQGFSKERNLPRPERTTALQISAFASKFHKSIFVSELVVVTEQTKACRVLSWVLCLQAGFN